MENCWLKMEKKKIDEAENEAIFLLKELLRQILSLNELLRLIFY